MDRSLRSGIVIMLLAAQAGCMTPRRPVSDPADYVITGPSKIWVTRKDGTKLTIHTPKMLQDTLLTGWADDGVTFIGLPMSQVKTVSEHHWSAWRTILMVAPLVGAAIFAFLRGSHEADPQIIEED